MEMQTEQADLMNERVSQDEMMSCEERWDGMGWDGEVQMGWEVI